MVLNIKKNLNSIISILLIIGLSVIVIVLVDQNQTLKRQLGKPIALESLKINDELPELTIRSIDNEGKLLPTDNITRNNKSLIFIFTTTCRYCNKSMKAWSNIFDVANKLNYKVIGISLNDSDVTKNYVKERQIPFQVFIPKDSIAFIKQFKLNYYPQTLRVVNNRIVDFWGAGIDPTLEKEILNSL